MVLPILAGAAAAFNPATLTGISNIMAAMGFIPLIKDTLAGIFAKGADQEGLNARVEELKGHRQTMISGLMQTKHMDQKSAEEEADKFIQQMINAEAPKYASQKPGADAFIGDIMTALPGLIMAKQVRKLGMKPAGAPAPVEAGNPPVKSMEATVTANKPSIGDYSPPNGVMEQQYVWSNRQNALPVTNVPKQFAQMGDDIDDSFRQRLRLGYNPDVNPLGGPVPMGYTAPGQDPSSRMARLLGQVRQETAPAQDEYLSAIADRTAEMALPAQFMGEFEMMQNPASRVKAYEARQRARISSRY